MHWELVTANEPKQSARFASSLGEWLVLWGESGIYAIASCSEGNAAGDAEKAPRWIERAWKAYWRGEEPDVVLCSSRKPTAITAAVWETVLKIPFGKTLSYGDVAVRAGIPRAPRAVGSVMRANPWSLFLPCHRVIGSDGKMRGYGGPAGIALKERLLEYERQFAK